jgi:hypothetical protein
VCQLYLLSSTQGCFHLQTVICSVPNYSHLWLHRLPGFKSRWGSRRMLGVCPKALGALMLLGVCLLKTCSGPYAPGNEPVLQKYPGLFQGRQHSTLFDLADLYCADFL